MGIQVFRVVGVVALTCAVVSVGCGIIGANILDQYWLGQLNEDIDALTDDVQAGLQKPGVPGADGQDCWDLNGNRVPDLPDEDTNGDGVVDVQDCWGADGANGTNGTDGTEGTEGIDGTSCWDLNGNGVPDLATEDANGDGVVDIDDCHGTDGTDGGDGNDGQACWDLNGNGVPDLATEDANGDGVVDASDCQLTNVLARSKISAAGTNLNAPNNVTSLRESKGKYLITVELPPSFDTSGMLPVDSVLFPISVTPHPAFLSPNGPPADILVTGMQVLDFDPVAKTLELRIHMLKLPMETYKDADFTFVLLEP